MLQLRLTIDAGRADEVAPALRAIRGVQRLVVLEARDGTSVLLADVHSEATDPVVVLLTDLGVAADEYVLARMQVVAPVEHRGAAAGGEGFAWAEVHGEATASAQRLPRYLAFMAVAGVIAAYGVIDRSEILIVGAMAVAPDLMPICATAVGIIGRRPRLVVEALTTLIVGMALTAGVAAVLSSVLEFMNLTPPDFSLSTGFLGGLGEVDESTVIIALAAGVAAMMAFETRASAAVGVAISVTTIPASALLGVAIGTGHSHKAIGALAVLCTNIVCLVVAGSVTLAVRRAAAPYR